MRINIETSGLDISEQLHDQIKEKVQKLEHYFEKIIDAVVYLHQEPNHSEVEIKLVVPGDTLFVKEHSTSFPAAADIAVDTAKRVVMRYKERLTEKG